MAAESSVEYTLLNDVDTAVKTEMTPSVDENGDQIILEAECNKNSLYRKICLIVVLTGSLFALVFCLPLFFIICCAAVKRWRLYLTKRGVYYTSPGGFGCCVDHWFIPFEDIQDIRVQAYTKNNLVITVGPEKVKEFVHWCYRPLCYESDSMVLYHVKNADEFAEAVKREKSNVFLADNSLNNY